MEEMLQDYFRTDVWDVVERPPAGTEIHIVSASESDSVSAADRQRIELAGSVVHAVEMVPGKGAQLARSAGTSLQIQGRDGAYVTVRKGPSGWKVP